MRKPDVHSVVLDAIARAREQTKERNRQGVTRFLNNSAQAKNRRRDRAAKRRSRCNQSKTSRGSNMPPSNHAKKRKYCNSSALPPTKAMKHKRVGNRSGQLPCCGKRPERCKCWRKGSATDDDRQIVGMLDRNVLKQMIVRIGKADILTYNDTADMPSFLRYFPPHRRAPMHYKWGIAMFWRCFSNTHLWSCLKKCGALPPAREPKWHIVQKILTEYETAGAPSHGGYFRTTTLTKYRTSGTQDFVSVTHLTSPARETLAYKTMWRALPKKELTVFARKPTRATYKNALETFQQQLYGKSGLTKGKFNDYAVKCMLDGLLVNKTVNRHVISSWPMQCPAYKSQLPILFPGIKPSQFYRAACYLHSRIYAKHHFTLADSLAQLCWIKRKIN